VATAPAERTEPSGPPASSVLLVHGDRELTAFIRRNLAIEGFEVRSATSGRDGLAAAIEKAPDLVLVEAGLPDLSGRELCRRLRDSAPTAAVPIILLGGPDSVADRVAGLTAGADDHLPVPFDPLELSTRIRHTLRRSAEMRAVSPLTGLPGSHRIEAELSRRIAAGIPVAICYADLDNFKAFNDSYGFLRGDEVIGLLAGALRTAADEADGDRPFLGHVGGDDFVVLCGPQQVERLCQRVVELFDTGAVGLHDPADVQRGHLSVVDRQGHVREFPLVSVSIGVATSERRRFTDHRDAVAIATEMKKVAKAQPGSTIAIDRRSV
jgi:diguanylate cyclase (GGDEF)-like protein